MHHVHDLIMFYAAELEPEHGDHSFVSWLQQ